METIGDYEEQVYLYHYDWDVVFDWDITAQHTEHVGIIGMKETVIDDWTFDIITVNGAPASCFSRDFIAEIIDAVENDTDFLQCRAEGHSMDWYEAEIDRAYDEMIDRKMGVL